MVKMLNYKNVKRQYETIFTIKKSKTDAHNKLPKIITDEIIKLYKSGTSGIAISRALNISNTTVSVTIKAEVESGRITRNKVIPKTYKTPSKKSITLVFDYIKKQKQVDRKDILEQVNISKSCADKVLRYLCEANCVTRKLVKQTSADKVVFTLV